jgi:hypothetical protein
MAAVLAVVQVSTIDTLQDGYLHTGQPKRLIETRYLRKKVAAYMEPVVRNTNLGSFLIWGLEIRRNISFDKV